MRIHSLCKFFALSIFLAGLETSLLADDCGPVCCSEPVCCPESSCCTYGFNIGVDWLYWRVKEDNLRAGTFVDDFPDPVLKRAYGSLIQPGAKFNNGVRASVGYQSPCDPCNPWEIAVIYTYLPFHSKSAFREVTPLDEQTAEHRQFIIPNITDFPSFQAFGSNGLVSFTSLFTKWNGNISYVDIDIGYTLNCDCFFNLSPHIGCRVAWMTQHLHMSAAFPQPSTNDSTFGRLKYKERFQGCGIEGGMWLDWDLGCGFSFLGHLGGSILYSRFKLNIVSESSLGEDGPVVFIIDSGGKDTTATPTIDYFIGFNYEFLVCQSCISFHVGWEQRVWFNVNRMAAVGGCLSLQGLTLGVGVGF